MYTCHDLIHCACTAARSVASAEAVALEDAGPEVVFVARDVAAPGAEDDSIDGAAVAVGPAVIGEVVMVLAGGSRVSAFTPDPEHPARSKDAAPSALITAV
jgi:hypothetical protein